MFALLVKVYRVLDLFWCEGHEGVFPYLSYVIMCLPTGYGLNSTSGSHLYMPYRYALLLKVYRVLDLIWSQAHEWYIPLYIKLYRYVPPQRSGL